MINVAKFTEEAWNLQSAELKRKRVWDSEISLYQIKRRFFFLIISGNIVIIPVRFTYSLQPLYIGINKLFRDIRRKSNDWILDGENH